MLIQRVEEIIQALQHYDPKEVIVATWWSVEDVEMLIEDFDRVPEAEGIWNDIVWTLDKRTSDMVISDVNDELYNLVEERLQDASV